MGNNHWERQWQSQNGTLWCKKIPDSQVRLRHPDSFQGTIRRRKRKKKKKKHKNSWFWITGYSKASRTSVSTISYSSNGSLQNYLNFLTTRGILISTAQQPPLARLSVTQNKRTAQDFAASHCCKVVCCNHRAVQKVFSQHLLTTNVLSTLHGLPAVNLLKQSPGKS